MSKGQNKILDALMEESMDVGGLVHRTGLSDSFVRNSLRYLESTGQVEKVDRRIPYMYKIPVDNPILKHQRLVEIYKADLLATEEPDRFTIFFSKFPKSEWIDMVPNLEALAVAITRLNEEGKLLETLEDTA